MNEYIEIEDLIRADDQCEDLQEYFDKVKRAIESKKDQAND